MWLTLQPRTLGDTTLLSDQGEDISNRTDLKPYLPTVHMPAQGDFENVPDHKMQNLFLIMRKYPNADP